MHKKRKTLLDTVGYPTLGGLGFGALVGYTTLLSYPTAIGMCLGCAYTVQVFETLTGAYLYPSFDRFSRGKKLAFQMLSSFLTYILGWLIPVWIVGIIVGFSLLEAGVLIWLSIFIVFALIIRLAQQLVSFHGELSEKEVLEENLKNLAVQAELKALRAQINPHFLFNALNTIESLISTDPPKAEESIERLADIFRYILSASDKEFVTLKDELEFIDSYLEIEKARFGDRLKVASAVSPEVLDTPIPSLILQPLVENSIKHGTAKKTGELRVEITGSMDGSSVKVEIKDHGRGVPEPIKMGIYTNGTGLRNVNERLQKTYGEKYGLKIRENKPSGTRAVLIIPTEEK